MHKQNGMHKAVDKFPDTNTLKIMYWCGTGIPQSNWQHTN